MNQRYWRRHVGLCWRRDYIRYILTSEIYIERTDISGTCLYNVVEDRYDDRIFAILGLSEYKHIFPEVKDSCEISGRITSDIAVATGLVEGTPVAGGIIDIQAATLATGIVEATEKLKLNIIVGTWSINQYMTKTPKEDENLFMTTLCPKNGNWLITEGSATSASNLEWFVATFLQLEKKVLKQEGTSVYEICNSAIANTSPEDTDIVFLPFLYGSNTASTINGTLLNLRMSNERDHVIRAIYEGYCFLS